jgi:hypothetical protein
MATPTFILPSAPTYTEGFVNGLNVYPDPTNFVANQVPFTRATTATRTNAAGLIELVPYNLLSRSEQFDNANWVGVGVSVTADTSISPSGLLNADTINITSSSGYRRQFVSTLNSSNYTFSAYVKKSANTGTNLFELYYNNNTVTPNNGVFRAVIDLTNLTITTTTAGTITTGRPTIISSNLTSVGNGWYRAEISFTTGTAAAATISEFGFESNGTTVEFLAWGAQFVEGTNALPYQQTVTRLNRPRVDFSLGGCPNLLLEPQRTNLVTWSEQFDNANWQKWNSSVTANSTISPSGIQNADTYTGSGSLGTRFVYQLQSVVSGTQYTISVYAKKNTNNFIQVTGGAIGFGPNAFANFDLNNGVLGTIGSASTARIENVGNGWYRCSITAPAIATTTAGVGLYSLITSATSTQGETNTLSTSVFLWGAQVEVGAYPTSYIPTSSASVTRNTDTFQLSNVFTNNMISSAGGTWFVELRNNRVLTRDSSFGGLALSAVAGGNLQIRSGINANRLLILKTNLGVNSIIYTTTTDTAKIAIKWNGITADVFVNGTKVVSETAFNTTLLEDFSVTATDVPKYINSMALWNTPISDAECIAITTL